MSEPAVFGLVRDGERRLYRNRWAGAFLHREIAWGPDAFESWVTQMEEIDDWDDCTSGVVVDYDARKLVWAAESDALRVPRVLATFEQLLRAAWPGFEIEQAVGGPVALERAVGFQEAAEDEDDEWEERVEVLEEATREAEDWDEEDLDEEDEDEDEEPFGDDEVRAWVTAIDAQGAVRHWQLVQLPLDLLYGEEDVVADLAQLTPAEVPAEVVVMEGMWIDEPKRTIGLWGGRALKSELAEIREQWGDGWTVVWAERGYSQQCETAGPAGVPLDDAHALAQFLPIVLSTRRFDPARILNMLGEHLKSTAIKATGCLLVLICLPLVIFGMVSGNWSAVLISIAVTCATVIIGFKVVELYVRRWFHRDPPDAPRAPEAAGPPDERLRRARLDELLSAARLPALAAVEPLFPEDDELDALV